MMLPSSRRIAILGATGSIGTATVEVIEHLRQVDGNAAWVPLPLRALTGVAMIAPFFADVDTTKSNAVTYGTDSVNGRPAFGVSVEDRNGSDQRAVPESSWRRVSPCQRKISPAAPGPACAPPSSRGAARE